MTREEIVQGLYRGDGRAIKEAIKTLEQESILDKIRAEINGMYRVVLKDTPKDDWAVRWNDCIDEVLQIIDKYKAEMESKDGN
jgi:hypothetical protein